MSSNSFTDTAEVKISTDDIDDMTEEQCFFSTKRNIRGSKIQWAIHVCGVKKSQCCNPRIFLWVSEGGLTAKGNVVISLVENYEKTFSISFDDTKTKHCIVDMFALNRLNGFVTVHVTFSNYKTAVNVKPSTVFDFITDSPHYASDAQIHVDDKTIHVHRHFLCMISPVFQAEFTHDTKEARSGTIEINDFSFNTVKKVIDYCYGRGFEVDELSSMIDVLKFADKYDMKTVIKKFEPFVNIEVSLENFAVLAKYAWELEKEDIKTKCVKFYRDNVGNATLTPDFIALNASTKRDIVHAAASLQ